MLKISPLNEGTDIRTDKEENQAIEWRDINKLSVIGWHGHNFIAQLLKKNKI